MINCQRVIKLVVAVLIAVSVMRVDIVNAEPKAGYEIEAGENGGSYLLVDNDIIVSGGEVIVSGASTSPIKITGDAKVTLEGVTISPANGPAIFIESGVKAEIVLVGENSVKGAEAGAGINVGYSDSSNMASLIITGEGSLMATGGPLGGAGIGGNGTRDEKALNGNITINGGEIEAMALKNSAGIGGGASADSAREAGYEPGKITINDGVIVAVGNDGGAGIGGGDKGNAIVDVTGGEIESIVAGRGAAGIGSGAGSQAVSPVHVGAEAQVGHIYTDGTKMPLESGAVVDGNILQAAFSELVDASTEKTFEIISYDNESEKYVIEMPDGYYAFATSVKNTATYAIRGSKYYVEKDTSESDAASDTGKNVGLMAQTGVIPGRGYLYPAADVKTASSSDNGATSPRTLDDAGVWGCILVGSLATICYILLLSVRLRGAN